MDTDREWEERFDKVFGRIIRPCHGGGHLSEIRYFIRAEIEAVEERGRQKLVTAVEEGVGDVKEAYERGRVDVLAELEEKLPPARTENYFEAKGMNYYRTTVLELIRKIK